MANRYSKDELANLVIDYAYAYGIDPAIALEQIKRESANFRDDVVYGPFVGNAGEKGVSQFIPGTWGDWGEEDHNNAYDPDKSLTAWGNFMVYLLGRYGYDQAGYTKALQAYNGGQGNVDRGTVSSMAKTYAREILQKAGQNPIDIVTTPPIIAPIPDPNPNPMPPNENTLIYILAGAGILLALILFKD